MELLNEYLVAPTADWLFIAKFLIGAAIFIHLPFIGMLFGGAIFSVIFSHLGVSRKRSFYGHLAEDLIKTFAPNKWVVFALGIGFVPIFLVLYEQITYGFQNALGLFLLMETAFLLFGCVFLYFYKNTFQVYRSGRWFHEGCGVLGIALLAVGIYHYFAVAALLIYPEKWQFVQSPVWLLFSSNALLRFFQFGAAAMALTSVATLFIFYQWPENRVSYGEKNDRFVLNFFSGSAVFHVFAVPVLGALDIIITPSFTKNLYAIAAVIVGALLAALIGQLAMSNLWKQTTAYSGLACVVGLLYFVNYAAVDYYTRETAIKYETAAIMTQAEKVQAEKEAMREAAHAKGGDHGGEKKAAGGEYKGTGPIDQQLVSIGKKLSTQNGCNACHSVDGSQMICPTFKGSWGTTRVVLEDGAEKEVVMDAEYTVNSIKYSMDQVVKGYNGVMPPYDSLSDRDVHALAEYIRSLGDAENVDTSGEALGSAEEEAAASKEESAPADDGKEESAPAEASEEAPAEEAMSAPKEATAPREDSQKEAAPAPKEEAAPKKEAAPATDKAPAAKESAPAEEDAPAKQGLPAKAPQPETTAEAKTDSIDEDLVAIGKKAYKANGCNACHSVDGSKLIGPSFQGIWMKEHVVVEDGTEKTIVADADYIRHSIYKPKDQIVKGYQPLMVPYPNLSDETVDGIIEYIKSLGNED